MFSEKENCPTEQLKGWCWWKVLSPRETQAGATKQVRCASVLMLNLEIWQRLVFSLWDQHRGALLALLHLILVHICQGGQVMLKRSVCMFWEEGKQRELPVLPVWLRNSAGICTTLTRPVKLLGYIYILHYAISCSGTQTQIKRVSLFKAVKPC